MTTNQNCDKITRSKKKYSHEEWRDRKSDDKRKKPKRGRKGKLDNY